MRKSRFGEEQILAILREQEAGARTEEVSRRHGVSSTTFYKWKARYGGLEVSEARRLKALEDENRRLKKRRNCSPKRCSTSPRLTTSWQKTLREQILLDAPIALARREAKGALEMVLQVLLDLVVVEQRVVDVDQEDDRIGRSHVALQRGRGATGRPTPRRS